MKVVRKNNYVFNDDDSYDLTYWNKIGNLWNLEYLKSIKKDLKAMNDIIDNKLVDISDDDFLSLITRFYNVFISSNDVINFLSSINKKEYGGYNTLKTNQYFHRVFSQNGDSCNDITEDNAQIYINVITSSDFKNKDMFTYDEIMKLFESKDIVFLNFITKYINKLDISSNMKKVPTSVFELYVPSDSMFTIYEYDDIKSLSNFNNLLYFNSISNKKLSELDNDFNNMIIKILRNKIKYKNLLEEVVLCLRFFDGYYDSLKRGVIKSCLNNNNYSLEEKEFYKNLVLDLEDEHLELTMKLL